MQFAAALYRQAGSPAVSGSDAFTDTADGQWYSNAVLWASQQEIITGYGGRFGTNDPVTREQLVTMLWRRAGSPQTAADEKRMNLPIRQVLRITLRTRFSGRAQIK